jgi:fatty-acyl-CoA synthase
MFWDLGITDKEVISYVLPNTPETMFTLFGGETAGIVNPINPLLETEQIAEIMNASGTKIVVTLAPFPKTDLWDKITSILHLVPSIQTIIALDVSKYLGLIPRTIVRLTTKKPKLNTKIQMLDFHKAVKNHTKENLTFQRNIQPTDIASYFHTGGTTGKPKLAQHTHGNEIFNSWTMNQFLDMQGYKVYFCGLPWFHANGVIVTGLSPLMAGNCVLLGTPSGYRGEGILKSFWKIVAHHKVSFFSAVPTVLQMLLDVPKEGEDISSLEYALCGAAPLSVKLMNDFQAATDIKILEGYGFTEGTCVNSGNPPHGKPKIGSIGLSLPHHHTKIVILEEKTDKYLRDADIDEIGHIVCRGLNIFPGYKEEIHNENIWINDGQNLWYNTGDLGRKDADDYFWITGRKKELIIRGGHNIDPRSIEEPLSKHPSVAAVAAVGRPDKKVGELPAVYIQLKQGRAETTTELLTFATENISEKAAIPKSITLIDEMPLTAIGKIFKPALATMQIKEVFTNELSQISEIEHFDIFVEQVPKLGMVTKIKLIGKDKNLMEHKVNMALGDYTVKFEII